MDRQPACAHKQAGSQEHQEEVANPATHTHTEEQSQKWKNALTLIDKHTQTFTLRLVLMCSDTHINTKRFG